MLRFVAVVAVAVAVREFGSVKRRWTGVGWAPVRNFGVAQPVAVGAGAETVEIAVVA